MAEVTYRSAGVYTSEIDLTGPTSAQPVGTPAGVIGTANEGPAFVPLTVGTYNDFAGVFGATDGEKFGPLAVNQFLKNAQSLTYVRVLGIGDGKQRDAGSGKVTNAGFVVGSEQVQANGIVNRNPYAIDRGSEGRTTFLGVFMSASAGSTIFSEAGIQSGDRGTATATIIILDSGGITNAETFTLVDSAGLSTVYTINGGILPAAGGGSGGAADVGFSGVGGGAQGKIDAAAAMVIAINATSDANYTSVSDGVDTVTITQGSSGVVGNKANAVGTISSTTVNNFSGGTNGPATARPIIRGVLMAPSGVLHLLSGAFGADGISGKPSSTAPARDTATLTGYSTGSVNLATQQFTLLLNGHIPTGGAPNVITASFDVEDASYFANVFNTDPFKIEEKGHLLYSHYDIHPSLAVVTGAGVLKGGSAFAFKSLGSEPIAFIASGSTSRNSDSTTVPNYESFEERFTHPESPFVISQAFGGIKWNLFRIHSIGDGSYSNTNIKISIENLKPSISTTDKYGTFDLLVREWGDTDFDKRVLESFRGLSLDPGSDKFIARAIGDMYSYFDFDQATSSQKIVVQGDHPVKSNYIRVQQSSELKNDQVPAEAMPVGYRGYSHLVTSGSNPLAVTVDDSVGSPGNAQYIVKGAIQPPVPCRQNVTVGTAPNNRANASLYWGTQFMQKRSVTKPNLIGLPDPGVAEFTKFFPSYGGSNMDFMVGNNPGVADSSGTVLDCDRFNNNIFSMERISVRTGSDANADPEYWVSASYVRNGSITANTVLKTRAFKVDDLKVQGNRRFGKFSFFLQAGFDGSTIFNKDKYRLLNAAAMREMAQPAEQGGTSGPTVSAYRKALDIMGTKSDVDIKLLAVPGLRHSSISDYAIDTVESRFDALYIMDIEEKDEVSSVITSSIASTANVGYTVTGFKNRALNTSFAAAYFPDVVMTDPTTHTNLQCPPSVAVLGAFALNDAVGYPWFAPAGFTRGALSDVIYSSVPLNKANMDDLYDADINPLTSFPSTGVMVFGQKTLLAAASSLDRVNVRRLLINIRRKVRAVADRMLFEPNRQETLDKFSSLVQPILQSIQEKSGVDRFKVVIDATTTTQTDIENNTLRGKIFIQPTRTAEFVSLDFVLTNAGDAFNNA